MNNFNYFNHVYKFHYNYLLLYLYIHIFINKKPSFFSILYFVCLDIGKISSPISRHFWFAFICKTCRMFYALTVTIIIDMPYIYINVVPFVRLVIFLSPIINIFKCGFIVRRFVLSSQINFYFFCLIVA